MSPFIPIFGAVVGLSLGLTGGGGAILAVPLLVYGLGAPASEAVGISLASVGTTSLVGFLHRWKLGEVEFRTGLLFAAAGMIGAPIGAWGASLLPEKLLLLLFAGLMLIVAARLWRQTLRSADAKNACADSTHAGESLCRRDAAGKLLLTSNCAAMLLAAGVLTGVLSGLFGVGGGFVIVPALVLFSRMPIRQAIGTSLMVIALVSVSGIGTMLAAGRAISPGLAVLFIAGGIGGLFAGQRIACRLSAPVLQRVFVGAILAVAALVIARNLHA